MQPLHQLFNKEISEQEKINQYIKLKWFITKIWSLHPQPKNPSNFQL